MRQRAGCEAVIDALSIALSRGELFELVITDLGMPHVHVDRVLRDLT
jgi:hypothetical protein